jgi:hypothetical protein
MKAKLSVKGNKKYYLKGPRGTHQAIESRLQKFIRLHSIDGDGKMTIGDIDQNDVQEIKSMGIVVEVIAA